MLQEMMIAPELVTRISSQIIFQEKLREIASNRPIISVQLVELTFEQISTDISRSRARDKKTCLSGSRLHGSIMCIKIKCRSSR